MRPRLIREVSDADLLPFVDGPGPGPLRLRLFDADLLPRTELDLPPLSPRLRHAPLPGHTAALITTADEVLLVEGDGTVRWRHRRPPDPDPEYAGVPTPYADPEGTLWLYLPGEQARLAVLDPATGEHLAEYADEDDVHGVAAFSRGDPAFLAHPGGGWTGVHVVAGDWGSDSLWIRYADGRITVRECPGEVLSGVDATGTRYLAAHHDDDVFAMRAYPDGAVLASCDVEDVPGYPADGPYRVDYGAFLVDDDLVLACVEEGVFEQDVLLSSHTLHWVDSVDYGVPAPGYARPSGQPGRWLTRDGSVTRLWALR